MREKPKYDSADFKRPKPGARGGKPPKSIYRSHLLNDENGLDPQRQIFAKEYTDPTSRGYLNGTEAMLIANPHIGRTWAGDKATKFLHEEEVRSAIEDKLDAIKFGVDRRIQLLRDLAENPVAETQQFDENGTLTQTTRYEDRKSQIRAIDIANRMDGSYEKATAIGAAARRQVNLVMAEYEKRMMKEVQTRNVTPPSERSPTEPPEDEPLQSESQTQPS